MEATRPRLRNSKYAAIVLLLIGCRSFSNGETSLPRRTETPVENSGVGSTASTVESRVDEKRSVQGDASGGESAAQDFLLDAPLESDEQALYLRVPDSRLDDASVFNPGGSNGSRLGCGSVWDKSGSYGSRSADPSPVYWFAVAPPLNANDGLARDREEGNSPVSMDGYAFIGWIALQLVANSN